MARNIVWALHRLLAEMNLYCSPESCPEIVHFYLENSGKEENHRTEVEGCNRCPANCRLSPRYS